MVEITAHDVFLRDGLQDTRLEPYPTQLKIEVAQGLSDLGIPEVDLGSVITNRAPPKTNLGIMYANLADTAEVLRGVTTENGTKFYALVPTAKYLLQAKAAGFRHMAGFVSANETHNQKNMSGRSIDEILDEFDEMKRNSNECSLGLYAVTAFGYKTAFDTSVRNLLHIANRVTSSVVEGGSSFELEKLYLGDTFGKGIHEYVTSMKPRIIDLHESHPDLILAAHMHSGDRRRWGDVVLRLIEELGVTHFDTGLCGDIIGGCPTDLHEGNLRTPEFVKLVTERGHTTGVKDIDALFRLEERARDNIRYREVA